MAKNDFDIDFDFNEEYGFDPKAFLGTEEYDKDTDLDAFTDEELGLTTRKKGAKPAPEEDFDLDDDLDMEDFLNMAAAKTEAIQEEEPETEEELEELTEQTQYKKAKDRAFKLLGYKSYTRWLLKQRLLQLKQKLLKQKLLQLKQKHPKQMPL